MVVLSLTGQWTIPRPYCQLFHWHTSLDSVVQKVLVIQKQCSTIKLQIQNQGSISLIHNQIGLLIVSHYLLLPLLCKSLVPKYIHSCLLNICADTEKENDPQRVWKPLFRFAVLYQCIKNYAELHLMLHNILRMSGC